MSKKLFVGGLSWGTSEDTLHAAFEKFGDVQEVKVITDRDSGRSRGFGFVTFENDQDALDAIDAMNGTELDGRTLNVNEAKERESRDNNRGGGGYGGNRGGRGGRGGRGDW